jgi:hypothetical protein
MKIDQWLLHKCGPYEKLSGYADTLVRTQPLPQGFLWQCGKRYGFLPTLEEARAMAEGYAVHRSIPTAQRWLTLS